MQLFYVSIKIEPEYDISNNVVRLRPVCAYAQSDQSLCKSLEYSMVVELLTEHHLEFLSLKGGYRGSSESTLVKMSHCWKSHAAAQMLPNSQENGRKNALSYVKYWKAIK